MKRTLLALCAIAASPLFVTQTFGQATAGNSGTIRGTVLDPSGSAIPNATVQVQNPVSHYNQTAHTEADGNFQFTNVPYNPYHVSAVAAGFQSSEQDVDVRSPVPVEVKITLVIGASTDSVTVVAAGDLIETDSVDHTDIDRALFDKLPLEGSSSSLSSLVTLASPGISSDSNGLFHGLGDHASNSFSVDGQPITDQQSKVFSNQLPVEAVQSLEVIEGAPPAEYGDKTSVVIVVTTRSGLGETKPHGDITASYGSFGSTNGSFDLAYGGKAWGNYISANGQNTGRFLDTPEFDIMHDHGNQSNIFDRIDVKPSSKDTINLNLGFTRSWFQTPNSFDAENATAWSGPACAYLGYSATCNGLGPNGLPVGPSDQRSQIRTFNVAPAWTRLLSNTTVLDVGGYVRQDQYNYYPSGDPFADLTPELQLQSIGQNRRLTNLGAHASVSYVKGIHNIKVGINYSNTVLTENDSIGIVDPTANPVCLTASGNPYLNPGLTSPSGCVGALLPNPAFIPLLGCFDLTRTGPLPASDGCAAALAGSYTFNGHADVRETSFYLQDTITKNNWTFNLGVRSDFYHGLASGQQGEPRLGLAYKIKPTNSVLRLSYARTMETPFNENLVLASEGCLNPVIAALQAPVPGGACVSTGPLGPGHRNEFHAGFQQAFGRYLVIDGEYIWKYTHKAFDFSVLGNTPIAFPIEWASSKIPGYSLHATMPNFHGLSAFVVASSVAARFFGPQISGIGAGPSGASVFRIDHDEHFNETTHVQYQPGKNTPWISLTWRYDSGQVASLAPCAGGDCNNGPGGSDSVVDVSQLTPDQQAQAGLYCGSVHATPLMPISPNGLCPANLYGATRLSIPAPGTENNDLNPPRIAPRSVYDLGLGDDNIFKGDRYKISARLTVVNLMNKDALYNYLSTFSGTHYLTPRSITAMVGFHF